MATIVLLIAYILGALLPDAPAAGPRATPEPARDKAPGIRGLSSPGHVQRPRIELRTGHAAVNSDRPALAPGRNPALHAGLTAPVPFVLMLNGAASEQHAAFIARVLNGEPAAARWFIRSSTVHSGDVCIAGSRAVLAPGVPARTSGEVHTASSL